MSKTFLGLKNYFGPKKIILSKKIFGSKNLWSTIFLGQTFFWGKNFLKVKKNLSKNFFGSNIFLGQFFFGQIFWGHRVTHRDSAMGGDMSPPIGGRQMGGSYRIFGLKICWFKKNFWSKIFLVEKKLSQ